MGYLQKYLNKIECSGNLKLATSIRKTAQEVGDKYLKTFSFNSHEIGLLLGNIQSGKTGQMLGIICEATDLGFPVFLILTTDNIVLQEQTLERVRKDLDGFCICGESDAGIFIDNNLINPVIIVLKKNARVLKLWANVLNSTGFMRGNPLFVVDDEADAASLNTLVNQERQSSINRYLESIKDGASSSIYLQVTATPQALFLQTVESRWKPYFTYYFSPGESYLGGDFFFPHTGKPSCITYINGMKDPTKEVVLQHLLVSAQMLVSGERVSNCLIHPSVRTAIHSKYADEIKKTLEWCKENLDELIQSEFRIRYDNLTPQKAKKQSFESIIDKIRRLFDGKIKVLVMNGQSETESSDYSAGCNFIVGGNTLGRGITFPNLQTIYYIRMSKKPQADTMWQHSRMFGYDRDSGLMNVYMDEKLYKLFSDINATNNSMIAQVEKGIERIKVYYPEKLNPTRKNVLDNSYVSVVSGGTNYYPAYPENNSIEVISELLKRFDDSEKYYSVSLRFIKKILSHIIVSADFKVKTFQSVLDTILAESPTSQGVLIVRRERDVAQGTGALLSPNDWKLGKSFPQKVVLTMYQVTGAKGWGGKQLWIPNIKLPEGIMYYDVLDEK